MRSPCWCCCQRRPSTTCVRWWHDHAMVMFLVPCFCFVFVGLWWICIVALVVFIRTGGRGGEDDKMTVGERSVLVLYWQV